MVVKSAEPQLYSVDDVGKPTLLGVRDKAGNVTFPRQDFGSEFTGDHGRRLETVTLAGTGTIVATATVHRHAGDDIATPFTVASVVLDEGPLVRGVLAEGGGGTAGDHVRAVTTITTRDGDDVAELRFAVTSGEAS